MGIFQTSLLTSSSSIFRMRGTTSSLLLIDFLHLLLLSLLLLPPPSPLSPPPPVALVPAAGLQTVAGLAAEQTRLSLSPLPSLLGPLLSGWVRLGPRSWGLLPCPWVFFIVIVFVIFIFFFGFTGSLSLRTALMLTASAKNRPLVRYAGLCAFSFAWVGVYLTFGGSTSGSPPLVAIADLASSSHPVLA